MILSPSGGSIGLGFAIPSNLAKNIINQLKDTGEIQRAWLGVRIQEVTDEIAQSLGLSKTFGALVQGLTPDSPALKDGVNEGDINIGTFQAVDIDGDEITYSISNPDMNITQEGLVSFNIIPDFETKDTHTSVIRASNDGGFDEINLTVFINDSICEFNTAAVFDNCTFE